MNTRRCPLPCLIPKPISSSLGGHPLTISNQTCAVTFQDHLAQLKLALHSPSFHYTILQVSQVHHLVSLARILPPLEPLRTPWHLPYPISTPDLGVNPPLYIPPRQGQGRTSWSVTVPPTTNLNGENSAFMFNTYTYLSNYWLFILCRLGQVILGSLISHFQSTEKTHFSSCVNRYHRLCQRNVQCVLLLSHQGLSALWPLLKVWCLRECLSIGLGVGHANENSTL